MNAHKKNSNGVSVAILLLLAVAFSTTFPIVSTAQSKVDSLKQMLLESKGVDRMPILKSVIEEIRNESPLEALRYAKFLLKESQVQKNRELEAEAQVYLGELYETTGDLTKAISSGNKALTLFKSLKDQKKETELYLKVATYMAFSGEYQAGLSYLEKAKVIANVNDYEELQGDLSRGFGIIYYYLNEYDRAKGELLLAVEIDTRLGDFEGVDYTDYNLALVHIKLREYDQALHYLNKTFKYSTDKKDIASIGFVHYSFARLYVRMKLFDLAKEHSELAFQYSIEIQSEYLKGAILGLTPIIFAANQEFDKAIDQNDAFTKFIDSLHLVNGKNMIAELESIHDQETAALESRHRKSTKMQNEQYKDLETLSTYGAGIAVTILLVLSLLLISRRKGVTTSN